MSRPIVIFAGYFARYPLGGHILAELSCLIGLQKLGFDVVFVEGCGQEDQPFYDLQSRCMTDDPTNGIAAMVKEFSRFGLENKWCLVDSRGVTHGIPRSQLKELCRESAFLFSRASTSWTPEFQLCRKRIYLDVDPGFTQFRLPEIPKPSFPGYASPHDFNHHFTFAGQIGQPGCVIPKKGLNWKPTRPPFVPGLVPELLPLPAAPAGEGAYTTVMSWNAYGEEEFEGEIYGQKNREFFHIENLPLAIPESRFEIAIASSPPEVRTRLEKAGWILKNAAEATADMPAYLDYIAKSRAEISVAKHGYVKSRSGWFSDRTVAFLASGKPAIVQDTGFTMDIPSGTALLAFEDAQGAEASLRAVEEDYARHADAARAFALTHFGYQQVLGDLLKEAEESIPQNSPLDASE